MMGCGHNAHVKNGPTCKEKWTTLYSDLSEFGTTWSRWDTMKVIGYVYIANRISMNLLRMFSRNIHEMINAFMKTRPIFQPPHSRDFMDLQMMLCTTPFFKKHNL
jgi:hypothetical protein